ncbi:hypothetical protein O9992_18060 [Vibrio lentus]|nr:hypothetical protein [Vibrio lentus]
MQKIPLWAIYQYWCGISAKQTTERKRTELIIAATVNLVEPMKTERHSTALHRKKTSTLARWLNIKWDGKSVIHLPMQRFVCCRKEGLSNEEITINGVIYCHLAAL